MTRTEIPARPRRQLSLRLLAYILLVSSVATLLLSAWQLWADFERDVDGIEERFNILEQTTLEPLSNSVWALNEDQIRLLLAGMLNLDAMVAVELRTDQGQHYQYGQPPASGSSIVRDYSLVYRGAPSGSPPYPLGTLKLYASLDSVYSRLIDRAAHILVGQALKTFVVSVFILLIVQQLITRHLGQIADYARNLSPTNLTHPLRLERRRKIDDEPDELDRVETALNLMRESLLNDISRREAAERQFQQSEARYRQLFESSTDGLAIFDLDGRLLTANSAFMCMLGYSNANTPQLTIATLTPERWQADDVRILQDEILRTGHSNVYRKELLHHDGRAIPVSVRTWTVKDTDGNAQFLMSTIRDISHEIKIEEEKKIMRERMHESQRLETVGTLAGGIAHEFNNLLTPIKGYAELLSHEASIGDQARARAEAIVHAAERGRKLVEKIVLLGRHRTAQRVETNLASVVRETLELASLTRPPNVRTSFVSTARKPELIVDPALIHQAIMNLLMNAFHAMPDGGEANIKLTDHRHNNRSGLELAVSDTGIGISADILPRIFEPFFSTRGQGSGLGLAVVQGIVKGHDGEISVDSGRSGTTFRLWLPHAGIAGHSGPESDNTI